MAWVDIEPRLDVDGDRRVVMECDLSSPDLSDKLGEESPKLIDVFELRAGGLFGKPVLAPMRLRIHFFCHRFGASGERGASS
jgi:hypothetical protein